MVTDREPSINTYDFGVCSLGFLPKIGNNLENNSELAKQNGLKIKLSHLWKNSMSQKNPWQRVVGLGLRAMQYSQGVNNFPNKVHLYLVERLRKLGTIIF